MKTPYNYSIVFFFSGALVRLSHQQDPNLEREGCYFILCGTILLCRTDLVEDGWLGVRYTHTSGIIHQGGGMLLLWYPLRARQAHACHHKILLTTQNLRWTNHTFYLSSHTPHTLYWLLLFFQDFPVGCSHTYLGLACQSNMPQGSASKGSKPVSPFFHAKISIHFISFWILLFLWCTWQ